MIAPVKKLRKKDVEWLAENRCKHSHTYLEHYHCWQKEKPEDCTFTERVGFMDIESSNLKASFGYVISYCIKEKDGGLIKRCIKPSEIRNGTFDKNLLKQFNKDVLDFHRLVVYWGKDRRHDVPFLRTRCLKQGVNFPLYREILVTDLYDWCRSKLSLHRYGLATVCRELGVEAKGHPLDGEIWVRAMYGNQDALDYILEHNIEDVVCMEPVYNMLEPMMRNMKVTI